MAAAMGYVKVTIQKAWIIWKYFSQSIKDESLRDELQSLLGLINDKNYQGYSLVQVVCLNIYSIFSY